MNADELRRLSADAAERKKREAQDAQRKAAEEKQKRQREYYERCWEHARKIVMELDATVRKAASESRREVHLYSLNSSNEMPVKVRCVRGIFSHVTDPCKKHHYSYQLPDYAQYVYNMY